MDYYNVGTLAYELVVNASPFAHKRNLEALFSEIMAKNVEIPSNLSVKFQDFLQRLLTKDPKKRLGANGIDEILNHPWLEEAPSLPPINTPYIILEKIVIKMNAELDSKILIDCKNWFGKNNTLIRRNTYIEGFSFRNDNILDDSADNSYPSQEGGTSTKSLPQGNKVGNSTVPSHNSSKVKELVEDPRTGEKIYSSTGISKSYLPVIADDGDASLLGVDEFEDIDNKDSPSDKKPLYMFQPHPNAKNNLKHH